MMKKSVRYILLSLCGAVLAGCFLYAYLEGCSNREAVRCERLEVRVLDSLDNHFVSADDIRTFLDRSYGQYLGLRADSLDLTEIENTVDRKSAVLKSEAYITNDGTLHIDITQRKPVVRFQKKDGGFYADADGYIFPLQKSYASHVQVIDGHIPLAANSGYKGEIEDPKEQEWFFKIMNLVNFLETKGEWRDKIVQIHVTESSDLILIPRIGNERFIFGQPDALEEKFERIRKYYPAIVPEKGSDKYRTVDIRYNGQIICR